MKTSFIQIKGVNGTIGNEIPFFDADERIASWSNLTHYIDPKIVNFTTFDFKDRAGDVAITKAINSNAPTQTTLNSLTAFEVGAYKRLASTDAILKKTSTVAFVINVPVLSNQPPSFMSLPFASGAAYLNNSQPAFKNTTTYATYAMLAGTLVAAQSFVVMMSFNESENKSTRLVGTAKDVVTDISTKLGAFADQPFFIGANAASEKYIVSEIFLFDVDLFDSAYELERADVLDYLRKAYSAT